MTTAYKTVRRLRTTGQCKEALAEASAYIKDTFHKESHILPLILIESATCHLLLHQFQELRVDVEAFKSLELSPKGKESCLLRLLYATARVHTDLALRDAWEDAKEVGLWHISGKQADDLDSMDIQIVCFYCAIEFIAIQLLDVQPPTFSPSKEFLESLRKSLLSKGRIDDLVMIHINQSQIRHQTSQISSLEDTLEVIGPDDVEMQVHVKVMLAHAFKRDGDIESARRQLETVQKKPLSETNYERQLFAQYLKVGLDENSDDQAQDQARQLLSDLLTIGNYHSCELLGFWLAEIELRNSSIDNYTQSVKNLLERSHSFHLPPFSDVVLTPSGQTKASQPTYSAYMFWQWYMNYMGKDMKKQDRSSLAATCCRRFLYEMQQCSVPEMKYTFMTVIAEYYEQNSDASQVLQWRQKANVVAQDVEDEEIRQQAECAFRLALADEAVVVLDDIYGVKQADWTVAQKLDLENLFCEAKERNDWYRQFEYARKLLEKELDEELYHGRSPCGKQWHSEIDESLKHLDNEKQLYERPRIAFMMAHAKFGAGDFEGCISTLREVFDESLATGNKQTALRALFTTSRAYLELFQTSKDNADWDRADAALLRCQTLCEEEECFDVIACCHIVHAMLWHAKKADCEDALKESLKCITDAQRIWSAERMTVMGITGLDTLLTHYAMTGRNAKTPHSVYGLAVEICFELGRFDEAYQWAECGKAQAFHGALKSNHFQTKPGIATVLGQEELLPPELKEPALLVHWVINSETIYICACRNAHEYFVFKLEITTSAVEEWHQNLVVTKDNLSEADSANEMLSELEALCQPLVENQLVKPGDLLILCPTSVLFRIPIHAIPISGGSTLLERHPVVYTHSFSVLKACLGRRQRRREGLQTQITIMGNATNDTPAGEASVHQIATRLNAPSFIRQHATKDRFVDRAPKSQLIHIHGHVLLDAYPLDQSMLFHQGEFLKAREVFGFDLAASHPHVVLIGCGSGVERLDAGDEPLGLISGFLYAGASTVVATMWPIHDSLAGAAFSENFYDLKFSDASKIENGHTIDIARRLQRAALSIKAKEETKAPYFWAGFVVHGDWELYID